jgi:hypothetical protein
MSDTQFKYLIMVQLNVVEKPGTQLYFPSNNVVATVILAKALHKALKAEGVINDVLHDQSEFNIASLVVATDDRGRALELVKETLVEIGLKNCIQIDWLDQAEDIFRPYYPERTTLDTNAILTDAETLQHKASIREMRARLARHYYNQQHDSENGRTQQKQ